MNERESKGPEAAGEHSAERFAREVGALSVVLPTDPGKADIYAKTDVVETWKRFGWEQQ